MRLWFDPDPPFVRWCRDAGGKLRTGCGSIGPEWLEAVQKSAPLDQAAEIGYLLHHGGAGVRQPVLPVTPEVLAAVRGSVRLLPAHNELTLRTMQLLLDLAPRARHLLFCDTAFFTDMPDHASAYAVPARLRGAGMRRYGGCGLLHQWAWQEARRLWGPGLSRLVSVAMGDHTNLAAIKDGRAVDTTIGFTPVEGVPSHTSCGDIDASVVFELQSSGMSLSEINELLSARSGFRGLLGKPCGLGELARENGDPDQALARRMLVYGVVKYAGAFAAALGGVDAVVFAAAQPRGHARLIADIRRQLAFLAPRSAFKTAVLKGDPWRIMSCRAAESAKEG